MNFIQMDVQEIPKFFYGMQMAHDFTQTPSVVLILKLGFFQKRNPVSL